MATGGQVSYCVTPDTVDVRGRVGSGGTKAAPSNCPKFTPAKTSTGVYTITFAEQYAQYLGTVYGLEAAGQINGTFNATTRVLTVNTFAADGTTATDKAFSFIASFSENKAA